MFSSFSSFSNPFRLPRFLSGGNNATIAVDPVEVHDVEIRSDKRSRTLKHLLRLNHVNNSIIYHDLEFHNHMAHVRFFHSLNNESILVFFFKGGKELDVWEFSLLDPRL